MAWGMPSKQNVTFRCLHWKPQSEKEHALLFSVYTERAEGAGKPFMCWALLETGREASHTFGHASAAFLPLNARCLRLMNTQSAQNQEQIVPCGDTLRASGSTWERPGATRRLQNTVQTH